MSQTKTLGYGLIGAGVFWLLAWAAFFLAGVAAGKTDLPAAILGMTLVGGIVAAILWVAGGVILARAGRETTELADVRFEQRVLDIVDTRGSARIPQLAAELQCSPEQVKDAIYDLVGKRLFTGYVNWDAQRVYSVAAAKMPQDKCPNCGGQLKLAGKDVVVCPYCGTEIFLPPPVGGAGPRPSP